MLTLSRKDIIAASITGAMVGTIIWRLLVFWDTQLPLGIPTISLVLAGPLCFIFGVQLGWWLSKWLPFFGQFGRFCAAGMSNTALDFGGLNLFIWLSGEASGPWYVVAKGASFVVCVVNAYLWSKYWTFDAGGSGGGKGELIRFLLLIAVVLAIDVGVASSLVNLVTAPEGISPNTWANIGGAAGAIGAIGVNFVGQRIFVFKPTPDSSDTTASDSAAA